MFNTRVWCFTRTHTTSQTITVNCSFLQFLSQHKSIFIITFGTRCYSNLSLYLFLSNGIVHEKKRKKNSNNRLRLCSGTTCTTSQLSLINIFVYECDDDTYVYMISPRTKKIPIRINLCSAFFIPIQVVAETKKIIYINRLLKRNKEIHYEHILVDCVPCAVCAKVI